MVTKAHITKAYNDMVAFVSSRCEEACPGGNPDCMARCHGEALKEMSSVFLKLQPEVVSPDEFDYMVKEFKKQHDRRWSKATEANG